MISCHINSPSLQYFKILCTSPYPMKTILLALSASPQRAHTTHRISYRKLMPIKPIKQIKEIILLLMYKPKQHSKLSEAKPLQTCTTILSHKAKATAPNAAAATALPRTLLSTIFGAAAAPDELAVPDGLPPEPIVPASVANPLTAPG